MSRLILLKVAVPAILASALTTTLSGTTQSSNRVPVAIRNVASAGPFDIARLLVNASIPTGLEIRDKDRGVPVIRVEEPNWQNSVTVEEFIGAFNSGHGSYSAVTTGGVIVIRPTVKRVKFLDTASSQAVINVTGVRNAVRLAFVALIGAPKGGSLGSYITNPALASEDVVGEFGRVYVDTRGKNTVEILNEIVTQVPSQGWIVTSTERPDGEAVISQFGVLHRGGSGSDTPVAPVGR